ncbi:MAG: VWA domain-containing protein [Nanoarchaeota archaeon]|nr:VWA domain-containing protein [Nanoarchaeota archaeon]MBU4086721.1 VWA domain-containing protein [Nanoarchaeota archaeon]
MPGIYFLYPRLLFLLFLAPFFIFVYLFSFFYNKKKAVIFPNFEIMEKISGMGVFSKNFAALYLNVIVLCLLIFSVAGMGVSYTARTSSQSYVIVLDSSSSMGATDFLPNRLETAKTAAKSFIDSLPVGTEVGIISFSGNANVVQEKENSKLKLKMALDGIDFGTSTEGTNVYGAIIAAQKVFAGVRNKAVILISDGQINVGSAEQIVNYANQNGIVIHTFAIGTSGGGITEFNTVSKVDEEFLQALSLNTGGLSFSVGNAIEFDKSFSKLLQPAERDVSIDISFYLILASIGLFSLNWVLYNFRFRIVP